MAQNATTDDEQATTTVADVLGNRIFNPERGMSLGVAVAEKEVVNGYGDRRHVFVCANAPGDGTTLRDVDDVLAHLENGYELRDDPWADER